jgi:hypothetical protein
MNANKAVGATGYRRRAHPRFGAPPDALDGRTNDCGGRNPLWSAAA